MQTSLSNHRLPTKRSENSRMDRHDSLAHGARNASFDASQFKRPNRERGTQRAFGHEFDRPVLRINEQEKATAACHARPVPSDVLIAQYGKATAAAARL